MFPSANFNNEDKTMNNWMDYAKAAADMAATLTKQYGPEAWETILWIQRIEALTTLAPSLLMLIAPISWYFIVNRRLLPDMRAKIKAFNEAARYRSVDWGDFWQGWVILWGTVINVIITLVSFVMLCSVWTWVQLFKPDLYLAKLLIDKVIN